MTLELGYIGRIMRDEYMNINIDQVPWMLTLGGQSFAKAYAATEVAGAFGTSFPCTVAIPQGSTCHKQGGIYAAPGLPAQPFFETTLASSGYCAGYANCTAAFVDKEGAPGGNLTGQNVYSIWGDLASVPGTVFNNSTIGGSQATSVQMSGAFGRGNYNGAIVSLTQRNWKGLTVNTNFTWSRSLGTQLTSSSFITCSRSINCPSTRLSRDSSVVSSVDGRLHRSSPYGAATRCWCIPTEAAPMSRRGRGTVPPAAWARMRSCCRATPAALRAISTSQDRTVLALAVMA